MPRPDPQQGLMPSILDRLIAPDAEGARLRHGSTIEQVIDAVRRDLEDLLNTHRPYVHFPEAWEQVSTSVLLFGMPDLMSVNATEREQVAALIQKAINLFEPRLRDVRVVLQDNQDHNDFTLRFHIEARVNVDPAPEVAFETVVELTTGHTSIKSGEAQS